MEQPIHNQSFVDLLGTAGDQIKMMLKIDTSLFRAEMEQTGSNAISIALWVVAAIFCMLLAMAATLEGLIFVLFYFGLPNYLAAFAAMGVFAIVGVVCVSVARSRLKDLSVVPDRTIAALKSDLTAFKKAMVDGIP